jgi:hypothetical protein
LGPDGEPPRSLLLLLSLSLPLLLRLLLVLDPVLETILCTATSKLSALPSGCLI